MFTHFRLHNNLPIKKKMIAKLSQQVCTKHYFVTKLRQRCKYSGIARYKCMAENK